MLSLSRIADLLTPFASTLSPAQLDGLSLYLDLLLRWNARLNLTAVRDPESIVTRHIGESLFAAAQLECETQNPERVFDLGSGAGFPGLPIKIYSPVLRITLIESQHKKATFLREVIRALGVTGIDVFFGRAEDLVRRGERACLVTMRAVERFDTALPLAAALLDTPPLPCHPKRSEEPHACHPERSEGSAFDLSSRAERSGVEGPCVSSASSAMDRSGTGKRGRATKNAALCLLIGAAQVGRAHELLRHFTWRPPVPIPLSSARVVLIGEPARLAPLQSVTTI